MQSRSESINAVIVALLLITGDTEDKSRHCSVEMIGRLTLVERSDSRAESSNSDCI
jgi:hypothetical protein